MEQISKLDGEELRVMVRQRLQARSHWMILLSDQERSYTPEILAAIDAQPLEDTERVRVDLWSIDLYLADADDGTVADLGAVLVISWPRLAMPIEILHAVLSSLFGQTLPVTQLLGRPIIVPVVRERMRRTGAQLHALQGWLFGEDDV
jgi:hypothetical protein